MAGLLVEQLRASDAPPEQYQRLGLPETGPVTPAHLLVRTQWDQVEAGRQGAARAEEFTCPDGLKIPLKQLLAEEKSAAVLRRHVPDLVDGPLIGMAGDLSLLQIAAFAIGLLPRDRLHAIADELAR